MSGVQSIIGPPSWVTWTMPMPDDQNHFVSFHHSAEYLAQRISALEANQRMVNKAILAYVEADIASTWMATAKELSEVLREALKE